VGTDDIADTTGTAERVPNRSMDLADGVPTQQDGSQTECGQNEWTECDRAGQNAGQNGVCRTERGQALIINYWEAKESSSNRWQEACRAALSWNWTTDLSTTGSDGAESFTYDDDSELTSTYSNVGLLRMAELYRGD
jgi:hypothetical protein